MCPIPDYTAYKDCTCPPFICTTLDFKSPLDMTALPAVVSLACWPPWSPSDEGLLKQPPQPTIPGSGAAMAARHLRFVFLQVMQMLTAYQDSFDAMCPIPDYTAYKDCTCPPFICTTLDFKSPLDMTALPAVVSLACWPPWSPSDEGLLKQPPQPTISGSGAAMAARHLRFVFLQVMQMVTAYQDSFDATCPVLDYTACKDCTFPPFICTTLDFKSPLDMTTLPAVVSLACWPPWSPSDEGLLKQPPQPTIPGSGAAMAAMHLRFVFLQVMQVVTAYQGSFDATCPVPDYTACKDCTCPPFIFTTLDFKSPLDMTALPGVVSLACWPPWSPSDKGLLKQPPQPTTPGSGAAMSAKHLRFVFLQKLLPRRRSCLKKLEFRSTLETTILPEKSLSQLQKCPVLAVALGTQSAMLGFATTVLPTNDLQSSGLDGTAHVDQCVITEINVARVKASAIAPKLVPSYHVNVREGIKGFDATTVTSGRVTGTSDMLTNPFRYAVQGGL
ncbi:uncharacterized protein [Dermacentor albipictus]|uniref:uncharacterized protein isoform X2 n=1 Tax=Dermacentor albipictus TaxID=60249 RepID=UPI0031FCB2CE